MRDERELICSDLPEPLKGYAEAVGVENLLRLARMAGGKCIYIPTEECLKKYGLKRRIMSEAFGLTAAEIAKKYGVSIATAYRYMRF